MEFVPPHSLPVTAAENPTFPIPNTRDGTLFTHPHVIPNLHQAASVGDIDQVKILLQHDASAIDAQDDAGWTAMHHACAQGHAQIVTMLICNGASLDLRTHDGDGWSCLGLAASRGHLPVVQQLLSAGMEKYQPCETFEKLIASDRAALACQMSVFQHLRQGVGALHQVDVDLVFENQRASSLFLAYVGNPSPESFSADYLQESDICGTFCSPKGVPCKMEEVNLPQENLNNVQVVGWYWVTDWAVYVGDQDTDSQGWQYAKSFYETDYWKNVISSDTRGRRRKWIRIRRRKQGLVEVPDVVDLRSDYIARAKYMMEHGNFSNRDSKLTQLERCIQVLLNGIRDESDDNVKTEASQLAHQYLSRASDLQSPADTAHPDGQIQTTRERGNTDPTRWQHDEDAPKCKSCKRIFTLWLRRHHCRWCGKVFCDKCSSKRAPPIAGMIYPSDSLHGPYQMVPPPSESDSLVRVCDACYRSIPGEISVVTRTLPRIVAGSRSTSVPEIPPAYHSLPSNFLTLQAPSSNRSSISGISAARSNDEAITDCPICGLHLDTRDTGMSQLDIEEHLNDCLTNGTSKISGESYIAATLKQPLAGECSICFEEYQIGQRVARLNCFCLYHQKCLDSWMELGKLCPVHYR